MKRLLTLLVVLALAVPAAAQIEHFFGWEQTTSTILGMYPTGTPIIAELVTDRVFAGQQSLKLTRNTTDTPQAWIAFVHNLRSGDQITVTAQCYDDTPGTSPSGRLWANWNNSLGTVSENITQYNGSPGGMDGYSEGPTWGPITHTWTAGVGNEGMIVQVRVYGSVGMAVWIDNLVVTVPQHVIVRFPGDPPTSAAQTTWSGVKALFD